MFESYLKPPISFPTITGSIVTFNSQYAGLPLKSHTVAVTATQSGSGTPSPDNVRTINGYSDINIGATGKNLFSYDLTIRDGYWANGFFGTNAIVPKENANGWQYIRVYVEGLSSVTLSGFDAQGGTNCAWLSSENTNDIISEFNSANKNATKTVPSGAKYLCLVIFNIKNNSTTYPNAQVEIGNTATDYQPFGTYTTITIGSTVYGGEYDARTGVLTVTQVKEILRGSYFSTYSASIQCAVGGKPTGWLPWLKQTGGSCEMLSHGLPTARSDIGNVSNGCFIGDTTGGNQDAMFIKFAGYSSLEDIQALIEAQYNSNTPVEVVYKLATPQTIQLPPCPIDTLEGVNNIWADTGDTTLQYIKFG